MQIVRVDTFDDERLGDYAGVRDPVRLRQRGAFLAEGRLVLTILLSADRFRLRSVLGTSATLSWMEREGLSLPAGVPFFHIETQVLAEGSGYRFHQGCLAAADVPDVLSVETLAAKAARSAGPLVVLEGVSNPDNVGAIFRTAAAFRSPGVVLDAASASPLYRKAVRTSMGAALRLPFHHGGRAVDHVSRLQSRGVRVLALTPSADACSLEAERAHTWPRALLLGAEGAGLSAAVQGAADVAVRIPMDAALDSLNVAAAAAIALYRLAGSEDA